MIDLAAALGIATPAADATTTGSTEAAGDFAQALLAAGVIADAEGSGGDQAAAGDTEGNSADLTAAVVEAADEAPAEGLTPTTDDSGAPTDRPVDAATDLLLSAGAELAASPAESPEADSVANESRVEPAPLHANVSEGSAPPASAAGADPAASLPTTDNLPPAAGGLPDAASADRAGTTVNDPAGSFAVPTPTDAHPGATDAGATAPDVDAAAAPAAGTTSNDGAEGGVSAVVDPAPGASGPAAENAATGAPEAPPAAPVPGPIEVPVATREPIASIPAEQPVATAGAAPAAQTVETADASVSTSRPVPAAVAPTTAPPPMTDVAAFVTPTTADASPLAATEAAETASTPAPAGGREQNVPAPAQQIAEALREVRRLADGTHRLSLQLQPRELGTVQLEIALRDGQLHLHAVAERDATARTIEAALPELRSELRDAGVEAGSLEVRDHGTQSRERERNQPDRTDHADRPVPGGAPEPAGETDRPDRPSTSTLVDVRI